MLNSTTLEVFFYLSFHNTPPNSFFFGALPLSFLSSFFLSFSSCFLFLFFKYLKHRHVKFHMYLLNFDKNVSCIIMRLVELYSRVTWKLQFHNKVLNLILESSLLGLPFYILHPTIYFWGLFSHYPKYMSNLVWINWILTKKCHVQCDPLSFFSLYGNPPNSF